MRRKRMLLIPAISVAGGLAMWGQSKLRPWVFDERRGSSENNAMMALTGTLSPMVTMLMDARNLRLAVPVNSWVRKGQSLGDADSGPSGEERTNDLDACRQAVHTAIEQARQNVREIEAELENARSDATSLSLQLNSVQTGELQAEQDFERRDALYREELTSELDHNASVSEQGLAESAVEAARSRLASASSSLDNLELRLGAAQTRLTEAMSWDQSVQTTSRPPKEVEGRIPILSPADGLIVSGVLPGTYGIASDTSLLRAHAQVSDTQRASLRLGQAALIIVDPLPGQPLQARISRISKEPSGSPAGSAYAVELYVENPAGLRFEERSVRITLLR